MKFKQIFIVTTALMIALTGCVKLPERTIREVPEKVTSYSTEQMYLCLAGRKSQMRDVYTDQIFNVTVNDGGKTYNSSFNEMVKDYLEKVYVMSEMSGEYGISLTDEEVDTIEREADAYMADFENSGNVYDVSRDDILTIKRDVLLIEKLRQQIIDQADIEVSENDARVMNVWRIECDDSETAYTVLDAVNDDPDINFEALARRNSTNADTKISVCRGDLGDTVEEILFTLEDGEVSPVIPSNGKYYIFKVINGYDEEATLIHKEEMAVERQSRAVGLKYEEYLVDHEYHIDEEAWNEAVKMCSENPQVPNVYDSYVQ